MYVTGFTDSTRFPRTVGSAQAAFGGGFYDGFVSRLNSDLTSLIRSTYLGGAGIDVPYSVAIHPVSGDVYVAGYSASDNFPGTSGGAQANHGGYDDAFVARLDSNLTTLMQSTYLGGSGTDKAQSLTIHPISGEVYVGGYADAGFPGTIGGAQPVNASQSDGFVIRLDTSLTTLLQSTYLGGYLHDDVKSVVIHPVSGDVFVTGTPSLNDFPGTTGGVQEFFKTTGYNDGYVSRLNSNLTAIVQSTFLGGTGSDFAFALTIHPVSGEVYVSGGTYSTDFPRTAGGAQPGYVGGGNAFISRYSPSLAKYDYTLTATQSGTGSGMVNATDGLITCGSDCSEIYGNFLVVTLSATPEAGSIFSGWSGACSNVVGDCVVTMDADKTATAIFNLPLALTVSKTGGGAGSVTSSDGGINCGADCSEGYASNAQVTLTATAETGSTFAFWSGDCSGSRTTCTVTMDASKSVTAKFNRIR